MGIIIDSAVILTCQRDVIKNFQNFSFVYSGSKLSYNFKIHYQILPFLIRNYLDLQGALPQDPASAGHIEEDNLKSILNNRKLLPDQKIAQQICLSALTFLLSSNTSLENEEVSGRIDSE